MLSVELKQAPRKDGGFGNPIDRPLARGAGLNHDNFGASYRGG